MGKPYVYLVGAGPGDEGLITVKGISCLQEADVILYDRLVNPNLLNFAKPGVQCIHVGKTPHHHAYPQEKINQLLVTLALEGKVVTRLKGGDPYVFGRGSEEALALLKAGIPFEVVPGITSAIGALSYGGIPVTHRNLSTSFHVITGHEDPTKERETVNYRALAQLEGTLIFLMGIAHLPKIVEQLIHYGKDPKTPAALVHRGTRAAQRVVTGTLETIVEVGSKAAIQPPAIIVIGPVVTLREQLAWFEQKPLMGKRIMVTRTRQQASELSSKLKKLGAEVVEFPTIEIVPNRDGAIDEQLLRIQGTEHLIFTSTNGVRSFFQRLQELKIDIRRLSHCKLIAVGKATAAALEERGLFGVLIPEVFTAEGIEAAVQGYIQSGDRVLLPRAEIARKNLVQALQQMGAIVEEIPLYATLKPQVNRELLKEHLEEGLDIITFTSASTAKNFYELLEKDDWELISGAKIAAIGPVTAKALRELGVAVHLQPEEYTIEGLIEIIIKGESRWNC